MYMPIYSSVIKARKVYPFVIYPKDGFKIHQLISINQKTKFAIYLSMEWGFFFLRKMRVNCSTNNSQSIMNSEPNQSARVLFGPAMRTAHQVGFPLVLIMINLD